MTTLGSCIMSDEMVMSRQEEEDHAKVEGSVNDKTSQANLPKLGAEFKKRGKEAIEGLILRQRFFDTKDRKILMKRRDDWIKDLNLNLIRGKVVKSTHYFEDCTHGEQVELVKALDVEPGNRENKHCETILKYIRSMTVFKQYEEFEDSDFEQIVKSVKLHKIRKNQRICNFGEFADCTYWIISGRVAITHPNEHYVKVKTESGMKGLRDRTEIMT